MSSSDSSQVSSVSSLVWTIIPVAITAAVYITIFLILRKSQRRFYAPRTYLGSLRESERTPALPTGFVNWFGAFWKTPDLHALQHQSLDAYLFLRFLRMLIVIAFVGCCILWPVLFPINATGDAGQTGLNILSYSNVKAATQSNRYYAHALIAWVFYGFVMYMILRESILYINLRQAFLLSPFLADRISSRTVMFVSVPEQYLDEARLRKVFGDSVARVWITANTEDVDALVKERDKVAMKLEKAEVKLLKLANKARIKAAKKGGADAQSEETPDPDPEPGSLAARWISAKQRPSHRTGTLGLVGPKVDTIEWCRSELERLIPAVNAAQDAYKSGSTKKIGAVFIEFTRQSEAESAYQVLAHHQALQMAPKYIGVAPSQVVWSSLSVSWWQRVVRRFAVIAFITALIIFWAIPVAVVGLITNIPALMEKYAWLGFLNAIPDFIMGVVTGLLPSVALSILMSLVPVIMRLCARLSGEPSLARVELFTQNAYFCFQVVQVFLVSTISSAIPQVAKEIADNPAKITNILAENIPKASTVYISYFIVQGLTVASGVISQVVGFVIFSLLYKYLTGTPRSMYNKWASLSAISWGSVLPIYTNIACVSLVYATIAPLMMGFAFLGLSLFWLAYRYNVLFVTDTVIDTRGLIYPRAIKHLLIGVYISVICMIGLFAASVAIGPLVIMIIFLIVLVLFNLTLNSAIQPLLYNLPKTLETEEVAFRLEMSQNGKPDGEKIMNGEASPDGKKPNLFTKFFKPWDYCDYATLRKLVPHDIDVGSLYSDEIERDAYYPPSVVSPTPLLWIPEDSMGISKQEVRDTSKVIPITDEGCILNDKNKLEWDTEGSRPPLWEEKVYY